MNYKIDSDIIKKILDITNILEIIKSKISLKKIGDYFFGLCPFHKEKNPSFSVNVNKKFYYCFGCKSNGNVINFLMNFEKLNFLEAISKLYKINNIDFKYLNKNYYINKNKFNNFYKIMKFVSNLYIKNFLNIKIEEKIYSYLVNKKWSKKIINDFNIGYSNNKYLLNKKKFKKEVYLIIKLGILQKINNQYVDRFFNRIIFPIYNNIGNIVGFGARSINNEMPKYINSPENIIFRKRNCVYGLHQVIKIHNNNISKLLIVEGYTDVISLHNYGINYSVSILGSYLTDSHIKIIFKYTNKLIFCYDGDRAGNLSSIQTFKKILPYITDDREINFIILPKNEDPDSIINKIGKIKFENLINKSLDISEFLFNYILKINLSIIYNKIFIIKEFVKLINIIPGRLTKFFLKQKLSVKLNIKFSQLNLILIEEKYNFDKKIYFNKNNKYNPICVGINFLIKNPYLHNLVKIPNEVRNITDFDMKFFLKLVCICYKNNFNKMEDLLSFFKNSNISRYLINLLNLNTLIEKSENNDIFIEILNKIYILLLDNTKNSLILKSKKQKLNFYEKNKLLILNYKLLELYKNIK